MADDGETERLVTYYLWVILSPILIIFGTIGNFMCIAVMCRRSMRSSNASVYLTALALADTFVLYTGLLRHFLREVADIDVRVLSNVGCKIHSWLVYVSLDTSVWILVAFTFERILSVCAPYKVKSYCTWMSSILVIISILLIMMALNGHFLYGVGDIVVQVGNTTKELKCMHVSKEYEDFNSTVWPWIDFNVFCLIPFTVLIIGNSCIAVKVLMSARKTRRIATIETTPDVHEGRLAVISSNRKQARKGSPRSAERTSSMTVILLILNLTFLATTTPVSVYFIVQQSWWDRIETFKEEYLMYLTFSVVNLIMYINNSVNFILYCVTGSRFRKELQSMFRKHRVGSPTETVRTGQYEEPSKISTVIARQPLTTATTEMPRTASCVQELQKDCITFPVLAGKDNESSL